MNHPSDIDQLAAILRSLYKPGIRHPAYLLLRDDAANIIRLVTPWQTPATDDHQRLDQLTKVHAIIRAAAHGLGPPESTVLFHLLDLPSEANRSRRGIEARRAEAARAYSTDPTKPMSGASFLRRHEQKITLALADAIRHRLRRAQHTTHLSTTAARRPSVPPPASAFRPKQ